MLELVRNPEAAPAWQTSRSREEWICNWHHLDASCEEGHKTGLSVGKQRTATHAACEFVFRTFYHDDGYDVEGNPTSIDQEVVCVRGYPDGEPLLVEARWWVGRAGLEVEGKLLSADGRPVPSRRDVALWEGANQWIASELRWSGGSCVSPDGDTGSIDLAHLELTRLCGHTRTRTTSSSLWSKAHSPYSPRSRQRMVEWAGAGRTPREPAWMSEPWSETIPNWVRHARRDGRPDRSGMTMKEGLELRRLQRENRQLKLKLETMARVAAWLAWQPG